MPEEEKEGRAGPEPKPPRDGGAQPGGGGGTGPAARPPEPNLQERMEGLQGWMAEIERKQGRLTYFGAAAALLAVAAAAAALFLAVTTRNDAASEDDVEQIRQQVQGIQREVQRATEQQLQGISETLGSLDQRIEDLKRKQAQDARDIADLQRQVRAQAARGGQGGGATPPGAGGVGP